MGLILSQAGCYYRNVNIIEIKPKKTQTGKYEAMYHVEYVNVWGAKTVKWVDSEFTPFNISLYEIKLRGERVPR